MHSDSRNINAHGEPHSDSVFSKLNWLRAAVLGANDGIVSVAALIVGVAGATTDGKLLFQIGIAALIAGALSMAVGEYVSVSSQRDGQRALLRKEQQELRDNPKEELEELTTLYEAKGLSRGTAEIVARELTKHDAFKAHVDIELGINPNDLTNPTHAAFSSAIAFSFGALIPLLAMVLPSPEVRIPATFGAVFLALVITGVLSARIGGARVLRATTRVVLGGLLAMIITYAVGIFFGTSVL